MHPVYRYLPASYIWAPLVMLSGIHIQYLWELLYLFLDNGVFGWSLICAMGMQMGDTTGWESLLKLLFLPSSLRTCSEVWDQQPWIVWGIWCRVTTLSSDFKQWKPYANVLCVYCPANTVVPRTATIICSGKIVAIRIRRYAKKSP